MKDDGSVTAGKFTVPAPRVRESTVWLSGIFQTPSDPSKLRFTEEAVPDAVSVARSIAACTTGVSAVSADSLSAVRSIPPFQVPPDFSVTLPDAPSVTRRFPFQTPPTAAVTVEADPEATALPVHVPLSVMVRVPSVTLTVS